MPNVANKPIMLSVVAPKKTQLRDRGWIVEQKLTLSCSLRCDQVYDNHCYDFDQNLLCCSSPT
jgi:hypothetical protein